MSCTTENTEKRREVFKFFILEKMTGLFKHKIKKKTDILKSDGLVIIKNMMQKIHWKIILNLIYMLNMLN